MPTPVHSYALPLPLLLILALVLSLTSACRPINDEQFKFVLVSQEVAVEQARFTFALLDEADSPVEDARVSIEFLPPDDASPPPTLEAVYRTIALDDTPAPDSEWYDPNVEVRGIYVIDRAPFSAPGEWQLRVSVQRVPEDSPVEIHVAVQVLPESRTPALGERVKAILHPTARDVEDLSEISTSPDPLPEMYAISIAEALAQGRPFLVAFTTPAFCQSRICGPVLETVASLAPTYAREMEFIHVEPYDLEQVRGGGKLIPSREARAWGLPSEPWIFLVDSNGRLTAKFEGIVTYEEMDKAIRKTLVSG